MRLRWWIVENQTLLKRRCVEFGRRDFELKLTDEWDAAAARSPAVAAPRLCPLDADYYCYYMVEDFGVQSW